MINYETIKNNPTQFLAMTSMKIKEFEYLLDYFEPHWENYHRHYTLTGERRKRPVFEDYSNDSLPGATKQIIFSDGLSKNIYPATMPFCAIWNNSRKNKSAC